MVVGWKKNKYWVWKKMGIGKTNIDLDGQLTNFPGQTQRVEAQGLAQLGTTNGSIRLGTTWHNE